MLQARLNRDVLEMWVKGEEVCQEASVLNTIHTATELAVCYCEESTLPLQGPARDKQILTKYLAKAFQTLMRMALDCLYLKNKAGSL